MTAEQKTISFPQTALPCKSVARGGGIFFLFEIHKKRILIRILSLTEN